MPDFLDASSDAALQDVCKHFNENPDVNLDWDYLSGAIGLGKPPGLPGISVPLKLLSAGIVAPRRLVVLAQSEYGQAVIVIYYGPLNDIVKYEEPGENQPSWRLYFGLNVAKDWAIAELPAAGALDGGVLGAKVIQFLVTTTDLTDKECKNLYQLVTGKPSTSELGATDYTKPPLPPLTGVSCRALLKIVVEIVGSGYVLTVEALPSNQPAAAGKPDSNAPVNSQAGSLRFLQLGASYDETGPAIKLNIGAELGYDPFKLVFKDLTLSFPLAGDRHVGVSLGGVGISGAIGDAAAFAGDLVVNSPAPLNMWGGATLEIMDELGASVMCGYSTVDGKASFFGFGFINFPVPAPEPFEIDGAALGLAYNRDLIIPPVDKLDTFPFIKAAMSLANPSSSAYTNPFPPNLDDLNGLIKALQTLGTDTAPPKDGSYWFNIGLAFSVAQQVFKGFALLSVVLGDSTRISAVGEVQATLPPQATFDSDVTKLVFIDSFIELVIDLAGGVIGLDAYIKHNSYVVEKNAHLTGGLGIRIWFDGQHAGQFVISAGGYSPRLDMSAYSHYPNIPRLAMTMDLGGGVQVKGKTYFALTQAMVMYGTAFQVSGKWGVVELWAIVSLDELVSWDPFHYDADVSVEVGASLRIKVWFVHVTITVHVGASLHIWGPPFSAYAHLDLSVCTVSWHLGADAPTPPPLSWDEFKARYLPAALASESLDTQSRTVARIEVGSNKTIVLKRQVANDIAWVVDPETTTIVTSSAVPSKKWSASFPGGPSSGDAENTDFGVAPCSYDAGSFNTSHEVTIDAPDGADVTFRVTARSGPVSAAVWGSGGSPRKDPAAVCGPVIIGLKFEPVHPEPEQTRPADADNLLNTQDVLHLTHLEASRDHTGDFDGVTVSATIASSKAANNRRSLFAAFRQLLNGNEIPDITADDVDVSGFANGQDADLFISPPRLRLLGEDRM